MPLRQTGIDRTKITIKLVIYRLIRPNSITHRACSNVVHQSAIQDPCLQPLFLCSQLVLLYCSKWLKLKAELFLHFMHIGRANFQAYGPLYAHIRIQSYSGAVKGLYVDLILPSRRIGPLIDLLESVRMDGPLMN